MPSLAFIICLFCCTDGAVFSVLDYGAKGDGKTVNTKALQNCIQAVSDAGGGVMLFPNNSGVFISGSLFLCSNIVVQIANGATLLGSVNYDDYPSVYCRDGGTMEMKPASLVNGAICLEMGPPDPNVGDQCINWGKLSNVTLTGGGTIDGSGAAWWNISDNRPHLLDLMWISGLVISNLTIQNSPSWNVHPTFSSQVEISYVNIYAPSNSPNTDGIDPDSCSDVYIHDSTIDVGDDCIAIKSGKDEQGRQIGIPTQNVVIERMNFKHGHGVSIGCEMSGGVRNVTFRNCNCTGTDRAVRVKTCRGRGGVIEDISYLNFTTNNVTEAVNVNMYYCNNTITPEGTPIIRNIQIINLTAVQSNQAGEFMCLPESPCTNLTLTNIKVASYTTSYTCEYAYGTQQNLSPNACLLPPLKLTAS